MRTMLGTLIKGSHTVQYPKVKEAPTPRARGVITFPRGQLPRLHAVARECPDWCIYIEGHKYKAPRVAPAASPARRTPLDRFDIDFAL
ncbi:MAG: hypothetical protein Ct9H300mP12_12050 [Acidimicrobiales bacterium]|nr:MAG: hypothetical protein Ct9H300mP12_12050 [Acidimicrobiales bacterium]